MPLKKYLIYGTMLIATILVGIYLNKDSQTSTTQGLLTDPFLQMPRKDSIHVVWFTGFKGKRHFTNFGSTLEAVAEAKTTRLSRIRETGPDGFKQRSVWRHEAVVKGLTQGVRTPYRVTSVTAAGKQIKSGVFSLQPLPESGQALKILLTSDHEQKSMTPANLQKVVETVGMVDAVFFAGNLTNIADNARQWFDDPGGLGFFAVFQGRIHEFDPDHPYQGGQILQYAPIFPCVGNHDVMGRFDGRSADVEKSRPRWYARLRYDQKKEAIRSENDFKHREKWIQNETFNTITYEEIFTLPDKSSGGELYYDLRFGDIYLASLFITRAWRRPDIDNFAGGKFHERLAHDPETWLFGDFIFEDFGAGSKQYQWLQAALSRPECRDAKYRMVMSHQTSRGVGDNTLPLLSHPLLSIEHKDPKHGTLIDVFDLPPTRTIWQAEIQPLLQKALKVRYDYPRQKDQWRLSIEPLLLDAGIQLAFHGHSHLWYRLQTEDGLNYLETSNVGKSYGAYLRGYQIRKNMPPFDPNFWDPANFAAYDDPYGTPLKRPTLYAPMSFRGRPLPTVDADTLTVFSILETETGIISSYVFDTTQPEHPAVKFDEFKLAGQ